MGKPEQITKKSHRGESKSPKTKVKLDKNDFLKTLRKYAEICEHNTVKEIIKHKTYKEGYYKKVKEKLKEHTDNIKNWSPAECLATYIYIVSMYTDKTSYEYNFKNSPANQSGAFEDFYDKVIKKIPEGQQKGTDKDPLYRIFNRVTKLHRSEQFNDYNAYNEIVKYAENAEGKSPEELEAKREQRIEKESQKLKEMFDTINAKIEKMGEFNDEKINEIIKESMKEYKQYGSRGFTIACSYLNKFLDGNESYNKKIKKYDSKEEHTKLEEKVNGYLNEFVDLYNQKYHKEYLKNKLKTSIKGSFGSIKELSVENLKSARKATRVLIYTINELAGETKTDDQLTEEQKDSFNDEFSVLRKFLQEIILNFVSELDKYFEEEIDISSVVILESGEFNFNLKFNGGTSGITEIDSSNILYLEEAFRPLFECLNVMYQEARRDKTTSVDYPDGKRTLKKFKLEKWDLKDWLENGSSSSDTIILYPAKGRPEWSSEEKHAIKFYKTGRYYIYDIGETLGRGYYPLDRNYDDRKDEHPFFLAVEDVFEVSTDVVCKWGGQGDFWNTALYWRSWLKDTPFFKLKCKWHEKLSNRLKKLSNELKMEEINFNPIPTRNTYFELFPKSGLRSDFKHETRYVKYVCHEKYIKST